MDLSFKSASSLAEAIRSREIGARELLEHHLKRVDRFDGRLNAIVVRDFDRECRGHAGRVDADA